MPRCCGVKECSIEQKRTLFKEFKNAKFNDDGKAITINVVFHICFKNYNTQEIQKDVDYTLDMLNKDFQANCYCHIVYHQK